MSPAVSRTPGMQQNPPPQPPGPAPCLPAGPDVVPILPTRVRQPGRQAPLPDMVAVRRLVVPDPAPPFDDEIPASTALITSGNEVRPAAATRPAALRRADPGPRGKNCSAAGPDGPGSPPLGTATATAGSPGADGRGSPPLATATAGPYAADGRGSPPPADSRVPAGSPRPDGPGSPPPGESDDQSGTTPRDPRGAPRDPGGAPRDPGGWPSQFAQVLAETLAGSGRRGS